MDHIAYPDPIPRRTVERMVADMAARMGWDADRQEKEIGRAQRKTRTRKWLAAMGVEPTPENRRAFIEQRRQEHHNRIRREREGNVDT